MRKNFKKSFRELLDRIITNLQRKHNILHLSTILFYLIVSFLLVLNFLFNLPPSKYGDVYGHIFRIWLYCKKGLVLWDDNWYLGYPTVFYYPYLAHLIGSLFCKFSNEIIAYKMMLFLSTFLAGIISYWVAYHLTKNYYSSFLSSIFYTLNPFRLRIISPEGNLAMLFAYSFLPLVILIAKKIKDSQIKEILLASLVFSAIFLSHHVTAIFSIIIFLIFLFYFKTYKYVKKLIYLAIFVFTFASHLYIPSILFLKYAHYLTYSEVPELLKTFSADPYDVLLKPKSSWTGYLSLAPLLLSESSIVYLANLGFLILSFGWIRPLYFWIPILNRIPIYRYLIIVCVLTYYLFMKKLKQCWIFGILLLLVIPYSVNHAIKNFKPEILDQEDLELIEFLKNNSGRFWFVHSHDLYSFTAYLPAITGNPNFDGWSRESNLIFWKFSKLRNHLIFHKRLYNYFYKYNIRYVILNKITKNASSALEAQGFKKVFENKKWVVYENPNVYFVCPLKNCTILANENYYKKVLCYSNQKINVTVPVPYFPLWNVYLDGKEIKYFKDNESGLISFEFPVGRHLIELKLKS